MQLRRFRLRFRRDLRQRKRQLEGIGIEAERQLERNFFRRFSNLLVVRRFVASWLVVLLVLGTAVVVQTRALGGYYQTLRPVPGGIFRVGLVGAYTNANPVYVSGEVDSTVSRLLFAGLFTYDVHNRLVGDLASGYSVDASGETYAVHLRPHLTWQDGRPLTAGDVAFTYHVIQSPDAQSPLYASWQGVTVTAPDSRTVVFKLPNPLSSFPYSLTTGIIPQHILGGVPMGQMRSVAFNTTRPVGAGPFAMQALQVSGDMPDTEQQEIALKPFGRYHAGKPKLDGFVVHAFGAPGQMVRSFDKGDITAMSGLPSLPTDIGISVHTYSLPLTAGTFTFFKTSSGVLGDATVRQALVVSTNMDQILHRVGYAAKPVNEPLLMGQLGYNPAYQQLPYDPGKAIQELAADGWEVGEGGLRYKNDLPLSFGLYAPNDSESANVAKLLRHQWRAIGANVQLYLQDNTTFQATVAYHSYDALLYSISIGVDPDVFVYWDSSQADVRSPTRLNFSEWNNATADAALEAGRTRTDPALRAIKYQPFLQAWQQEAPALGLYQPRFLYVAHGPIFGLSPHAINADADCYDNVQDWMINQAPKTDQG